MVPDLESILDGIDKISARKQELVLVEDEFHTSIAEVMEALRSFSDIVRYLNTRRSKGARLELIDEAAVQDALYLMLRPWISDLVPENPTDKVANRSSIKDFVSHKNKFVIEAKFVRNKDHGKQITKELNDDIETYRYHNSCNDLIFFIYDPEGHIPDAAALERHLQSSRVYDSKILRCHAVIKP